MHAVPWDAMVCDGMAWDAWVHGVHNASVCFLACFEEQEAQEEEVDTYQIDAKPAKLAAQLHGRTVFYPFYPMRSHVGALSLPPLCMNESQCICFDKASCIGQISTLARMAQGWETSWW